MERLYGLPREEFLPARDALSKELRAAGDRDAAAQAKALRKPTVAAWALNRLARDRAEDVRALLDAGDRLRGLQRKAASGVGREELREATLERRRGIDGLVRAAEDILTAAGHPTTRATLDHVARTLEVTATDERAREVVERGILDRELEGSVGFEDMSGLTLVAQPVTARSGRTAEAKPKATKSRRRDAAAPSTRADDRAAAREREREAKRRARLERLAGEADELEAEARRLAEEAANAERAAMKARAAADRATRRAAQARTRADQAAGSG